MFGFRFFRLFGGLLAGLLLAGCSRGPRFAAAEEAFRRTAQLQSRQLGEVLGSYAGADPARIGTLHAGYLRDGTFARLDSLDGVLLRHLEVMQLSCTRRNVSRLVACLKLHFRLSRRLTDAEIPFDYRRFPPPWEYLEPGAAAWPGIPRRTPSSAE